MARVHLFEFEDQSWCPSVVRETTTDFLLAFYQLQNIYEPVFPKISETLDKSKTNAIIDCCSGSGGPIKRLREYLDANGKKNINITLTDMYPNIEMFKMLENTFPNITAKTQPLDASQLPASLQGMRTLFSSFHHFKPELAVKILQDAVNNDAPIGIFEFTERHPLEFLKVIVSPLVMLIFVPFAKRMTWKKFLFTYIIPVTPFTHMWEYFVSCLRTYSPKELAALVKKVNAPNYHWEMGKMWSKTGKCHITYLIGYKASS